MAKPMQWVPAILDYNEDGEVEYINSHLSYYHPENIIALKQTRALR